MRISDWSSDVCSSDLAVADADLAAVQAAAVRAGRWLGADHGLARRQLLHDLRGRTVDAAYFTSVAGQALWILVLVSAPVIIPALAIGVLLGMVQAATSINEATLSFVPKLLGVPVCLGIFGGLMMGLLMDFTIHIYARIPALVRRSE